MSTLTHTSTVSVEIEGTTITANLPLYLFMHPHIDHKLQIDAVLVCGNDQGTARIKTNVPMSKATELDVTKALLTTKLCKCKCGNIAFDPSMDTNRNGKCETCFIRDLMNDYNEEVKKDQEEQLANDRQKYSQGYRYKIEAWIHPSGGGDDYVLIMHTKDKLSKARIVNLIAKEGCKRTDDYTVTELVTII